MSKLANLYKFNRRKVIVFLPGLCLAREWLNPVGRWEEGEETFFCIRDYNNFFLFIIIIIFLPFLHTY